MSALWQVLLKNSQTQLQCIKALIHKLEKSKDKLKVVKKRTSIVETQRNNQDESIIDLDDNDEVIRIPQKTTQPNLSNISNMSIKELSPADLTQRKEAFAKMINNLKKGNQEDPRLNYFPNNCMVVNSIIKCLQNPNVHVVKGILDLLIAYISFQKGRKILYPLINRIINFQPGRDDFDHSDPVKSTQRP
jgi:hypothetical protein